MNVAYLKPGFFTGCVEVVGCVTCDELVSWEAINAGVHIKSYTMTYKFELSRFQYFCSFCWAAFYF